MPHLDAIAVAIIIMLVKRRHEISIEIWQPGAIEARYRGDKKTDGLGLSVPPRTVQCPRITSTARLNGLARSYIGMEHGPLISMAMAGVAELEIIAHFVFHHLALSPGGK